MIIDVNQEYFTQKKISIKDEERRIFHEMNMLKIIYVQTKQPFREYLKPLKEGKHFTVGQ